MTQKEKKIGGIKEEVLKAYLDGGKVLKIGEIIDLTLSKLNKNYIEKEKLRDIVYSLQHLSSMIDECISVDNNRKEELESFIGAVDEIENKLKKLIDKK